MFERFTDEARGCVVAAQEEARAMQHPFIGTEHLLLGLGADSVGGQLLIEHGLNPDRVRRQLTTWTDAALDADALATLGIDLGAVQHAIEERFGPGALARRPARMPRGHIPFTKRAKKAVELALREAVELRSHEINSAHVLLGVLRERDGLAGQLIRAAGIDEAALCAEAQIRAGRRAA